MNTSLKDKIHVYALDLEDARLQPILEECKKMSHASCENFWVDIYQLQSPTESKYLVEDLISQLYTRVIKGNYDDGVVGAEFWVQEYRAGRGLAFHFDKDEVAMEEHGEMHQPKFSSILYLTGDKTRPRQGPTMILDQRFDSETCETVPQDPTDCVLVFPEAKNFLVFEGNLGHGVLESVSSDERMTLLVNWWTSQPQGIKHLSAEAAANLNLTTADCESIQSMSSLKVAEVPMHAFAHVAVDTASIPSPVEMDKLFVDESIAIRGTEAVNVVFLGHPGLAVMSVADQLQGRDVDCAAALVPLSLLESGDDTA